MQNKVFKLNFLNVWLPDSGLFYIITAATSE